MKKKELLGFMGDVAGVLSRISCTSKVEIDGERYEVHQFAHGAAVALGMFICEAKSPSGMDVTDMARLIIKATIDWERDNPELMGKDGEGK